MLAAALLPPVLFAGLTGQVWEDFFIAFRHAVNLVEGHGPTYQPGQRIQGFSSPLAVLVAAGAAGLADDPELAIRWIRSLGCMAFAVGFVALFRLLQPTSLKVLALVAALYLLDSKSIAFSANGMETGFVLAFLAASLLALQRLLEASASQSPLAGAPPRVFSGVEDARRLASTDAVSARAPCSAADRSPDAAPSSGRLTPNPLTTQLSFISSRTRQFYLGLAWAGLLWSRPDGAVFIALLAITALLFPGHSFSQGGPVIVSRRLLASQLFRAATGTAFLYLPWIVWAWLYYGSPIPLTVLAKQPSASVSVVPALLEALFRFPSITARLFLPPYAEFGGWDRAYPVALAFGLAGCLAFLVPGLSAWGRRASLCAAGGAGYLALMPQTYPWYCPPVTLLALLGLASLLDRFRSLLLAAVVLAGALYLGWQTVDYADLARATTRITEQSHRRLIGLWLRQHAKPGDRVYLECPGIIGFYSGLPVLDWPGLVTPEVVRLRRLLGDDMAWVAGALQPEWLVLRPNEVALFQQSASGWLARNYELAESFSVQPQLKTAVPQHPAALYDANFQVFRKR